jgi:hypothetical protein
VNQPEVTFTAAQAIEYAMRLLSNHRIEAVKRAARLSDTTAGRNARRRTEVVILNDGAALTTLRVHLRSLTDGAL